MKPLTGNVFFKSKLFDNQMVRTMGHCLYGAPDFGECLAIAFEIEDGNWESWYAQWMKAADRTAQAARDSLSRGHRVSAMQGFLRAAESYRTAGFALLDRLDDPRDLVTTDRLRDAFTEATRLFPHQATPVLIPYEGTKLPGYFFRADGTGRPCPTVIFNCGYHGFVEEAWFWGGAGMVARGYNLLAFDGPGQGQSLHRGRTVFRPDWENVVTPVVDFALTLPEVDPKKLVLIGRSFGACLAARAVTAEHRFAAFIADPGEYDQFSSATAGFPSACVEAFERGDDASMARHLGELLQNNPDKRFAIVSRMLAHKARTPVEYMRMMKDYTIKGIAGRIRCPTLVTAADCDDRGTLQPKLVFDELKCPKTFMQFTAAHGAGDHCESGAPSLFAQAAYDWLDEMLARP